MSAATANIAIPTKCDLGTDMPLAQSFAPTSPVPVQRTPLQYRGLAVTGSPDQTEVLTANRCCAQSSSSEEDAPANMLIPLEELLLDNSYLEDIKTPGSDLEMLLR